MHLVDWYTISKPHEYSGWNIKNLEWFSMPLRMKSLWMVLNGNGTWSHIIGHKYLKNLFVNDYLHQQSFPIQGSSYFWNGFIRSLSWMTYKLRWWVGNRLRIKLGSDPIIGLCAPYIILNDLIVISRILADIYFVFEPRGSLQPSMGEIL